MTAPVLVSTRDSFPRRASVTGSRWSLLVATWAWLVIGCGNGAGEGVQGTGGAKVPGAQDALGAGPDLPLDTPGKDAPMADGSAPTDMGGPGDRGGQGDGGPTAPELGETGNNDLGDAGDAGGAIAANVRMNDDPGTAGQNEVSLAAVAQEGGAIVAGWNDRRTGANRCAFTASRDGGKTWDKNIIVTSMGNGITGDPTVTVDDAGNLYLVCMDYGSGQIVISHSTNAGVAWSPWRVVRRAPDKPWVAGVRDGTLYLTWLGSPGGFSRSVDHGQTWEASKSLGSFSGGTAIATGNTGLVHIAYAQGSAMRYVRSKDWGATLEPGRNLNPLGRFCFNCRPRSFAITGAASDPTGQFVAITWSTTLDGAGGDGNDDVWVLISKDGGDTWTPPRRANSNPTASRQFQSWTAVDRSGGVYVTWTDLRNAGQNATYVAAARDPFDKFGPNIEITSARGAPPAFMGDYKGAAIQGSDLLLGWCDSRSGNADAFFARAPLARF